MIPADILTGLFILLAVVVAFLVLRWLGRHLAPDREPEPETFGDDGGVPSNQEWVKYRRAGDK